MACNTQKRSEVMIYLATPYSNDPEKNYELVLKYVESHMVFTGEVLFSPIIYGHNIATARPAKQINTDYETWKVFDKEMIRFCSELWVLKLDGWRDSGGVQAEVDYAKQFGKPIKYVEV